MGIFKVDVEPEKSARSAAAKSAGADELHRRSKYMNQSLEFLDWVDGLGFERTFIGRLTQTLDERFRLRQVSLLFFFSLFLSFLLFYDFDFTFSVRPGDVATHDLKSPLSFEMIDDVATEERRQKSEIDVPPVFDFDRAAFQDLYNRIYTSFRRMRDEVRKVQWSRDEFDRDLQVREFLKLKPSFEQILGRTVSEREYEWLVLQRFSPRIENLLIERLERWSQMKIVDGYDKNLPVGLKELHVREVSKSGRARESVVPSREVRDISRDEDFSNESTGLGPLVDRKDFPIKDQRMLLTVAQAILVPNVTFNRIETQVRRSKARDDVLPEVISIKKGQVIVAEGAKVKPIHVRLLQEIENLRSHRNRNLMALVTAILFVVLIMTCSSYLRRFTLNRVKVDVKDASIMGAVTILVVVITKFFLFLTNAAFISKYGSLIPDSALLFAAPAAAGTMLVGLLILSGEVVWIFSFFLAVVLGMMVDLKFSFMLVTICGSVAAARGVFSCKKRSDVYWAGLRTGIVQAIVIALVLTVQHSTDQGFLGMLAWSVPAGFLSGIFSAFLTMMLIPLLENLFNCTTDVKLMELSNLNHELLKEMIVKAPGTYHHSLVVGSMVEAASEEIAANPLLAKVMAYYHDIGKTRHAPYFIENQKPGNNPHDHLSPHMSKSILIAHVKDGVTLALNHKLGKPIIDGIVQHHGTTLISFFYNRAMETQDEAMGTVGEAEFRYPGPKPQFREAALIMLADSIEAASRSLDEPTPVRLQNIVRNIIQRKFMDGQLDECNLTLRDLTLIEESFTRVLLGIYHQRIDYPRKAGGGASESV